MARANPPTYPPVSFKAFFAKWAEIKGWVVPDFHWTICQWLEDMDTGCERNYVLQVFRGASKSTILGLYIAWKLRDDQSFRFLLLSADDTTAWRMSFDAQHVIETHPWCNGLKGATRIWQTIRWSVAGNPDRRNASVAAHGVMSNITGARCDMVILDDVEVPRNTKTLQLRDELRLRIDETTHILVPGGKKLFVGTPHHFESIYPEQIMAGATYLTIPLINEYGDNVWPDRFTEEDIAYRKKECATKAAWSGQYLLKPVPVHDVRLNPDDMITYNTEPVMRHANGTVSMWLKRADGNDVQLVGASCYYDVSLGKVSSDDSVLALILTDAMGNLYWQLAECLEGGIDEQCQHIRKLVIKYQIPRIEVEVNGPGGFVPAILRRHLGGTRCGIIETWNNARKVERILDAFEAPLSGRFLYVNETLMRGKLPRQMREWNPEVKDWRVNDDILDAGAGAIRSTPVRVGRVVSDETVSWQEWRTAGSFEATYEAA